MKHTATAALAALTLVSGALLSGCAAAATSADAGPSASAIERMPETTTPSTPTEAPVAQTPDNEFGPVEMNDHGNLVKQIGQLAGLTSSKDDDLLVARLAVTEIIPNYTCPATYSSMPANGQFIAIHLNVETTPELANEPYPSVNFSQWAWQAYDADNKRVNDVTGNGFSCLDLSAQLPGDIGPGQSVSGYVVLDVPISISTVVLAPSSPTGWEWAVPAS